MCVHSRSQRAQATLHRATSVKRSCIDANHVGQSVIASLAGMFQSETALQHAGPNNAIVQGLAVFDTLLLTLAENTGNTLKLTDTHNIDVPPVDEIPRVPSQTSHLGLIACRTASRASYHDATSKMLKSMSKESTGSFAFNLSNIVSTTGRTLFVVVSLSCLEGFLSKRTACPSPEKMVGVSFACCLIMFKQVC